MARVVGKISAQLQLFTESGLETQIGYASGEWGKALLKELIDNALDICESEAIAPVLDITIDDDGFQVTDNGAGLPEKVLHGSCDYSAGGMSDKAQYVSPSRGQQGNALKTLWAAPLVLDGQQKVATVITATYGYSIELVIDWIAEVVNYYLTPIPERVNEGTSIKIHSPKMARQLSPVTHNPVIQFALFNPHAKFFYNGKDYQPALDTTIKKWTPNLPTSPHWYDVESLKTLANHLLRDSREQGLPLTIRQFIGKFDRLKRTDIQRDIGEAIAPFSLLEDLTDGNSFDGEKLSLLLNLMKKFTAPIKPKKLGSLGEKFLFNFLSSRKCQVPKRFYRKSEIDDPNNPCTVEVAIAHRIQPYSRCLVFWGLNFTPIPKYLPSQIDYCLLDSDVLIDKSDPIVLVIHITMPKFSFTDKGKSSISLDSKVIAAIKECLAYVAKDWARLKRSKRRSEQATIKELKQSNSTNTKQLKPKQVAFKVMEQAYMQASNDNSLPASARQIFYQIRPLILEYCSESWTYKSFSGWLPEFIKKFPEIAGNWTVTYDPRGKFYEPHTGRIVDLGTKGVRKYINDWSDGAGHYNRFKFALFIEKEGFGDLFDAVNLGNRYDIAIFSTKGFSTTACRELVDSLSGDGITILCAHDFDYAGINIYGTMVRDNRRYTYRNQPNIIDIGLRLPDVQEMGLSSEPVDKYDQNPLPSLKRNACSQAEIDFLCSHKTEPYSGHRVELNVMPSNVLIDWLERKFSEYGVTKFVPDESILVESYQSTARRHLLDKFKRERINHLIEEEARRIASLDIPVPDKLAIAVKDQLKAKPLIPWDVAIDQIAEQFVKSDQETLAS